MAGKEHSRTQLIAALKPPPTRSGRVAFLVSCGSLIAVTAFFMLLCTGLEIAIPLLMKPHIAILSAVTSIFFATPYFLVLLWLDRNEPEPPHLIMSAWLWGAVLATGLSVIVNTTFHGLTFAITGDAAASEQLTASLSAPFVEELTKGLALVSLYLFFRRDFDNVLDGVFYGAMVGLGFATFENFIYYVGQDDVFSVLLLTLLRGVLTSVGSHACFTAITGASIGIFRVMRTGLLRWAVPPLGLALAMFVHFSWNTFTNLFAWEGQGTLSWVFVSVPLAVLCLQLPFVLLVLLVSMISLRHERRMIETYLSTEQPPVVLPGEIARLVPARRRSLHSARLLLTLRVGEYWTTRRRNKKLVRLAFEKWHMDRETEVGTPLEGRAHALAVIALRKELAALRLPEPAVARA